MSMVPSPSPNSGDTPPKISRPIPVPTPASQVPPALPAQTNPTAANRPVPAGRASAQNPPQLPQTVQQPRSAPLAMPAAAATGAAATGSTATGAAPRPVPVSKPAGAAGSSRPVPVSNRPVPLGQATTKVVHNPLDEPEVDIADEAIRRAPPWLVSAVFHAVLLVILGLWVIASGRDDLPKLDFFSEKLGDPSAEDFTQQAGQEDEVNALETANDLLEVEDPFATPMMALPDMGSVATEELVSDVVGLALSGRTPGKKSSLLEQFGGTAITEAAVTDGLKWLAKQQRADGSWSLKGPYTLGSGIEDTTAATAMAMLAFQGAGFTHRAGPYKELMKKGRDYLVSQQKKDGDLFHGERPHNWLYSHAQGTIALCELYALTKDPDLRKPAQDAVNFCIMAQHPQGGWRYSPREDRDTSVSGWMLMALQSARMGGLEVPTETLQRFDLYLGEASHEGGSRYSYLPGSFPDETMTAEGLLCRQYLGWNRDDERLIDGVDFLLSDHPPALENRNVYYWYYATQVMHHMGGEPWENWNTIMREMLPNHQEKTGDEAGSWNPALPQVDRWGNFGGRLYTTCLSIYILEVYYRHLPIYRSAGEE